MNPDKTIFIQENWLENVYKMTAILSRPRCVSLSFMKTPWNEKAFRITGHLWGDCTSHRWSALTKGKFGLMSVHVLFVVGLNDPFNTETAAGNLTPAKLPWIFPGAPLTFNGAPGNTQCNLTGMWFETPWCLYDVIVMLFQTGPVLLTPVLTVPDV